MFRSAILEGWKRGRRSTLPGGGKMIKSTKYKDRNTGKRTPALQRRKRRQEIERRLCEGGMMSMADRREFAARWGVSVSQITADVGKIIRRWKFADEKHSENLRLVRRRELERVRQLAAESYWRSRQDEIEITTEMTTEPCEDCSGTGIDLEADDFCERCDGNGERLVEKVRKKIKGQAGDSSFLKIMGWTVVEQARLEGLHVDRKTLEVRGQVDHKHLHAHATITKEDLARLSDDQLLELEAAQRRVLEAKPVPVESEPSGNGSGK